MSQAPREEPADLVAIEPFVVENDLLMLDVRLLLFEGSPVTVPCG